jgi:hypothetical protein
MSDSNTYHTGDMLELIDDEQTNISQTVPDCGDMV